MLNADPLAFLEEYSENEKPKKIKSDPLSFLDELSEPEKDSFRQVAKIGEESEASDLLSFLDEPEEASNSFVENLKDIFTPKPREFDPDKSTRQNIFDIYRPEEKTPEQLKEISIEERMQYAQELQNLRELQQATGFGKGALSGFTLSASEHIPGLKPDEDDLMVGLGEMVGSYVPIAKLYSLVGKPLVQFAAKSPVARQGLMALARMTGFGITGATYEAGKEIVQGEIPSAEELAKTGATWAGIDAILQSLGLGVAFNSAIRNIAETEGISAKEVLDKLWDSTKNFVKVKFGRSIKPSEILPEDIEVLVERTKLAEKEGLEPLEVKSEESTIPESIVAEESVAVPEIEIKQPEKIERLEPEVEVIDERPILKELLDLKEELSKTKGTTRVVQQRKKELADSIREKVKELTNAREHNKALKKLETRKAERPDITPKGLKQQKQFILDIIDDALANPSDSNSVVIDVPGD